MDKYAKIRAALEAVPCVNWTSSRATVHIPETEDWAGKYLSVDGLDRHVARKLARYIADTNPAAIRALLAERDALREALQLMVDRFGPCQDQYIFSKRSAIDKARAALAQGEA